MNHFTLLDDARGKTRRYVVRYLKSSQRTLVVLYRGKATRLYSCDSARALKQRTNELRALNARYEVMHFDSLLAAAVYCYQQQCALNHTEQENEYLFTYGFAWEYIKLAYEEQKNRHKYETLDDQIREIAKGFLQLNGSKRVKDYLDYLGVEVLCCYPKRTLGYMAYHDQHAYKLFDEWCKARHHDVNTPLQYGKACLLYIDHVWDLLLCKTE